MKKGTRYILGTLLVMFCVGIAMEGGLNAALSHLSMRVVNRLMTWLPGLYVMDRNKVLE